MSITRVCTTNCEMILGVLGILLMIVLFVGALAFILLQRSKQARRDREMDVERQRQLEEYRQAKQTAHPLSIDETRPDG